MTKINLLPHETIIMRDSVVQHDRGGLIDLYSDELLLTNVALIVIHKSIMGDIKDIERFSLDQVKVVNGVPQALLGTSSSGEQQLHVHFSHGVEAFTLGRADNDPGGLLDVLLVSPQDKEKRNIAAWQSALSQAVLALPQQVAPVHIPQVPSPTPVNTAPVNTASATTSPQKASSPSPLAVTKKCMGCRAPLSGVQGQKVTCNYCDTEQVL